MQGGGRRRHPRAARSTSARRAATRANAATTPVDHLVLLGAKTKRATRTSSASSRWDTSSRRAMPRRASRSGHDRRPTRTGSSRLTGCMGGVVAQQRPRAGRRRRARRRSIGCERAFEPGIALRRAPGSRPGRAAGARTASSSSARQELELPLVATNDVHYGARRRRRGAALPLVHRSGPLLRRGARARTTARYEMFLKSADEMAHRFRDVPEAITNTLAIAEMCSGLKLKLGKPMLPDFKVPEGFDTPTLLPPRRARGARASLSRSSRATRQEGRRGGLPQAPRDRARRHRAR